MHVELGFVGGAGHRLPLVPLATALKAAGHRVERSSAATPDPTEVGPLVAYDAEHEDRVLRDRFAGVTARARSRALLERWTESDDRPDLVVVDEVDFGGLLAAEALGIPSVSVVVLAAGGFARPELVGPVLPWLPEPDVIVAALPPRFRDPAWPLPAAARWVRPPVGPVLPAAERTGVYVTLGTVFNAESGGLFDTVLSTLAALEVEVVATVGRGLDPEPFRARHPGLRIEAFVPQEEVLGRVALVVCHGGSGSVVGALAHGTPLVTLPMGADQPHNARRCEALGVGRSVWATEAVADPDRLREAVVTVLDGEGYGRAAADLAREAAERPAVSELVPELEALVSRGRGGGRRRRRTRRRPSGSG